MIVIRETILINNSYLESQKKKVKSFEENKIE
jgi:hypothetical protein